MSTCRREVGNEEFILAQKGNPSDPASLAAAKDNRNVISAVLSRYRGQLPEHSLSHCAHVGLWKALQYHRPEFNQKFTTSLHTVLNWVCLSEYRSIYGRKRKHQVFFTELTSEHEALLDKGVDDRMSHVRECMGLLPSESDRKIINQYYFEQMTMQQIAEANGFTKETASKRVAEAVNVLRTLCQV